MNKLEEFIKEIGRKRDIEINYQKKCKCEDENSSLFLYMEGRIGAFSDVLLMYYFHHKKEGE